MKNIINNNLINTNRIIYTRFNTFIFIIYINIVYYNIYFKYNNLDFFSIIVLTRDLIIKRRSIVFIFSLETSDILIAT